MEHKGHKNIQNRLMYVITLCLCACLILSVGVTYARYRTDFLTVSYWFKSEFYDTIVMHGTVTDATAAAAGTWAAVPAQWDTQDNTAELQFSISNGSSADECATRDQQVQLQMIASLSIEDPQKLTVILTTADEEGNALVYEGVATQIVEGSFLHSIYGDGWVYNFYDTQGQEGAFFLKGETLSYRNFTLQVMGTVNPSLLSIEMNGAYVESE